MEEARSDASAGLQHGRDPWGVAANRRKRAHARERGVVVADPPERGDPAGNEAALDRLATAILDFRDGRREGENLIPRQRDLCCPFSAPW